MPALTKKQYREMIEREILAAAEAMLGGTNLDLIDTDDYRDIWDFISKPDPDEPTSDLELFLTNGF